jgi:hypothetical protein
VDEISTRLTAKADFLDFVNQRGPSTQQIQRFSPAQVDAGREIASTTNNPCGGNNLQLAVTQKRQKSGVHLNVARWRRK